METNEIEMNPRTVFMGSPEIAVPLFEALCAKMNVVGVVTQPDRPAGRGKTMVPPAIKVAAEAAGVPVFQPERLRRPEAFETLAAWNPELIVVMAYGQILRQNVLDLPKHGCINVHASLLPRWRGASPIQAAIRAGDAETGVAIMQMDAGMDTGPVYSMRSIPIAPDDTSETLSEKLAVLGAESLMDVLPSILDGSLLPVAQSETGVTTTGLIKKDDGILDVTRPAIELERLVRAYDPWPGTALDVDGKMIKVLSARVAENAELDATLSVGMRTIIGKYPAVQTGDGLLVLTSVQAPGRKPTDGKAFLGGYRTWVSTPDSGLKED